MPLPWEIKISLRQGTVYYMEDRALNSSESHYFIVLNHAPLDGRVLLLAVVSSQIEKVKRRIERKQLPKETFVEITESEYSDFTKDSCINCNQVFTKSIEELAQQFQRKEILAHTDMPAPHLSKIIDGTMLSPMVSDEDKSLIQARPSQ